MAIREVIREVMEGHYSEDEITEITLYIDSLIVTEKQEHNHSFVKPNTITERENSLSAHSDNGEVLK